MMASAPWWFAAAGRGTCPFPRATGAPGSSGSLASGTVHRANGEIACHVPGVMQTLLTGAESGSGADVTSSCGRPPAVPFGSRPDDPSAELGPRLS